MGGESHNSGQGGFEVTASEKMNSLLAMGEPLGAFIATEGHAFRRTTSLQRATVGAEVNVAVAVSRLGLKSSLLSRVGNDLVGQAALDDLRQEGVNVRHVLVDPTGFTGLLVRESPAPGAAKVSYHRTGSAATNLSASNVTTEIIAQHSMVHVSAITAALGVGPREASLSLLTTAGQLGLTRSLDLNYRAQLWTPEVAGPVMRNLASEADIVVGGDVEWEIAFGPGGFESAPLGDHVLAIHTGGAGITRARQGGQVFEQASYPTHLVDVVGAGDGFVGGLLASLLSQHSIPQALQQASYCGSRVVSQWGDWAGLPFGESGQVNIPDDSGTVHR